jgi:hypothetical protein
MIPLSGGVAAPADGVGQCKPKNIYLFYRKNDKKANALSKQFGNKKAGDFESRRLTVL